MPRQAGPPPQSRKLANTAFPRACA